jgi:tungstate transport system ATP-binding protein
MTLIEVVDLQQKYGEREILKSVNISIEKGEVFALIGPTGAGKTTLLRLIDLLDSPTSGKVYFDGIDVTQSGRVRLEARRRMAFVLQKPVVFNMSVFDNLACGLTWRRKDRCYIRQKVDDMMELIGLSAYKNRNARTLSGGEAQRVAIARALVIEPEVLLLDEPTANLDPVSTSRIEGLISYVIHQHNTTIIMSTHDISQGQRLADRIGVLLKGEMLQTGASGEIFDAPGNREVAEFVGIENIIDGVVVSNEEGVTTIDAGGTIIEVVSNYTAGEKVSICIRPEAITLALTKPVGSARNSFSGEIIGLVTIGWLTRVVVDCSFQLVALITKKSSEELDLKKGGSICASFKATGVHAIKRGGS